MARVMQTLRHWLFTYRIAVRVLLALATVGILLDGYWVERSVMHLLLTHPLMLLGLMVAWVATEELAPGAYDDAR